MDILNMEIVNDLYLYVELCIFMDYVIICKN